MPSLIFRYFWIVAIAVTFANAAMWWARSRRALAGADPSLREGGVRLIRGYCVFGTVPWLVMGAGILSGRNQSILDFLKWRNGPFAMAWWVTVAAECIALMYWVFLRGGAEAIASYPGILAQPTSPRAVKLYALACLAGAGVALSFMAFNDVH